MAEYLNEDQIEKIVDELEDHVVLNWNVQLDEYEDVVGDIINELNKRYKSL